MDFSPLPDIVLQCGNCKTIIGDTKELVCIYTSCDGAKLVVLKAATEVRVDQKDSREDHFDIHCQHCSHLVGRMYFTVPSEECSKILNAFAFDVAHCLSYQLGSSELRVQQPEEEPRTASTTISQSTLQNRIETLEADLLKIQSLLLWHDSQLQQLPGYQTQ